MTNNIQKSLLPSARVYTLQGQSVAVQLAWPHEAPAYKPTGRRSTRSQQDALPFLFFSDMLLLSFLF